MQISLIFSHVIDQGIITVLLVLHRPNISLLIDLTFNRPACRAITLKTTTKSARFKIVKAFLALHMSV